MARCDTPSEEKKDLLCSPAWRQTVTEIAAFVLLVGGGVAARLYFQHLPNFAPVAALALFAGYYFRNWIVALAVPLCVMTISDFFIGGYSAYMMAVVYGMLALPIVMRGLLRRYFKVTRGSVAASVRSVVALMACGLVSSLLFFAITNFGSWLWFGGYDHTPAGLMQCYAAALPFFRYTLTGDVFFALVLFSGYALGVNFGLLGESETPRPAVQGS